MRARANFGLFELIYDRTSRTLHSKTDEQPLTPGTRVGVVTEQNEQQEVVAVRPSSVHAVTGNVLAPVERKIAALHRFS